MVIRVILKKLLNQHVTVPRTVDVSDDPPTTQRIDDSIGWEPKPPVSQSRPTGFPKHVNGQSAVTHERCPCWIRSFCVDFERNWLNL